MSNQASNVNFRPIQDGEHEDVAAILQHYANQEILLWRNADDIKAHMASFFVAIEGNAIVGCVAVHDYGRDLYELRSLAVKETHLGRGLGAALVRGVIAECKRRNADILFALTRKTSFFEKLGFTQEPMDNFPEKVWKDCQLCRKRDCCDEKALAIRY